MVPVRALALAAVLAAMLAAVRGEQPADADPYTQPVCPPPDQCRMDWERSSCKGPRSCAGQLVAVIACKWPCNDDRLPARCTRRTKECQDGVCARDKPECEIVCPMFGPCSTKHML
ncbi:hypothetical protein H4R18_003967 [Coemansia javaensis]|uniref:Uncharacterized protein n=1 Tax=Coemansia javaensis TaxID=2761396 RepID=A0A9W8H913_9FUNG|nr:hypothetical protein H4R18_003967 [Coemansia javaensis]